MKSKPLSFKLLAECPITKARASLMSLPHEHVNTPVFMPVGTQGSLKGLLPDQLEALDVQIILGNTYHLGTRPVCIQLVLPTYFVHYFLIIFR